MVYTIDNCQHENTSSNCIADGIDSDTSKTTTLALRVSLPVFEGPLDLLLYLVKNAEVDIYDISIHQITQQYLAVLEQMEHLELEVAGEFLVMAAHLLYIKSRTLLPVAEQLPEEDVEEGDPRWDLIRQLIEYKKFKEAAVDLQVREGEQLEIFYRPYHPTVVIDPALALDKVTALRLMQAFQKALDRLAQRQQRGEVQKIVEESFTVAKKIEHILEQLEQNRKLLFSQFFSELASRQEMVVTFLALLELIRLKQVRAEQLEHFVEISIQLAI